jgi:dienelactone hydrolase
MAERRDITFDSHGTRCGGWHYLPDGGGPRPYVVMAHGLGATIELGIDDFAQRFVEAGYGVFAFDYRGFGFSEGEPRQVISVRKQLQDWQAALQHVRSLPAVDAGRIAIWGSSFAGGHVISVAARDHDIAAAIAQVPFTDGLQSLAKVPPATALKLSFAGVIDLARSLFRAGPKYVPLLGSPGETALMAAPDCLDGYMQLVTPEAEQSGRWQNRAAARIALLISSYAPRRRARRVASPLLVIAAENDSISPAKGAIAAAKAASKGELVKYPDGHFDYYKGVGFDRIIEDELAFLARTIGSSAAHEPEFTTA